MIEGVLLAYVRRAVELGAEGCGGGADDGSRINNS